MKKLKNDLWFWSLFLLPLVMFLAISGIRGAGEDAADVHPFTIHSEESQDMTISMPSGAVTLEGNESAENFIEAYPAQQMPLEENVTDPYYEDPYSGSEDPRCLRCNDGYTIPVPFEVKDACRNDDTLKDECFVKDYDLECRELNTPLGEGFHYCGHCETYSDPYTLRVRCRPNE